MSPMKILKAHFQGGKILLDESFPLSPTTSLRVVVWPDDQHDEEREEWSLLTQCGLAASFDEDKREYSLDLIKEPNPDFEGG
jgi:hypothetical protein